MDGTAGAVGRRCSVCSGDREAIEAALLDGESLSSLSSRVGISRTSLRRHLANHMVVDAAALFAMGLDSVAIVSRIADVAERARLIADDAIDSGNVTAALRAGDSELKALAGLAALKVTHEDAAAEAAAFRIITHATARAARADFAVANAIADELELVDQSAFAADIRGLFQETRKALS